VGQTVAASLQAPTLFLIAQDLTKMQVDTNVDEADIGRVVLDQEATFSVDSYLGQVFRGRVVQIRQAPQVVQNVVTYITVIAVANPELKLKPGMTANVKIRQAPQVVQNVVTYITVIAVANPELKLKPGMTANVKILVARRENALLVPNAVFRVRLDSALPAGPPGSRGGGATAQRGSQPMADGRPGGGAGGGPGRGLEPGARRPPDGGQQRVWVLQDGKPVERMIRAGLSDGQKTEVLEGLRDGESVIVGTGTQPPRGASGSPGSPRLRL